jgi:hypothetical protein
MNWNCGPAWAATSFGPKAAACHLAVQTFQDDLDLLIG